MMMNSFGYSFWVPLNFLCRSCVQIYGMLSLKHAESSRIHPAVAPVQQIVGVYSVVVER